MGALGANLDALEANLDAFGANLNALGANLNVSALDLVTQEPSQSSPTAVPKRTGHAKTMDLLSKTVVFATSPFSTLECSRTACP